MVTAKIIDLPYDIHGLTTIADDGSYIILLNARDSRERNRQSYLHELKHIEHNDLYCFEASDAVEYDRHK
ncbi:MAG: ImmA/IrrE family metallo-endopeptidase [Selenomonadaceae bacterium]|nr:ImmA/IrrE family metallo-endopeptidase [Selenomonadaceae bacterium]